MFPDALRREVEVRGDAGVVDCVGGVLVLVVELGGGG